MSLPSQTDLKIITRIWNVVEKQGISILIMGTAVWVFFSMFQDQIKLNNENMDQMRKEVKECNDYSRDVLQKVVEENTITMEKVNASIERLEDKK